MGKEYLECEDCGKQDETVRQDICPFTEEIDGIILPVVICPQCFDARCDEI